MCMVIRLCVIDFLLEFALFSYIISKFSDECYKEIESKLDMSNMILIVIYISKYRNGTSFRIKFQFCTHINDNLECIVSPPSMSTCSYISQHHLMHELNM